MSNRRKRRSPKPIMIGRSDIRVWKLGAQRFDLRDPYYLAVSLSWPLFILLMVGVWLVINLGFATLYSLSPGDVTNTASGSFGDLFFFSVETLATVGYGVMAPATLYAHVVSSGEIITGTGFTALMTGLLFVRFSRPKAKILYADDAVISQRNGTPTLMLRMANGRMSHMTNANARLFALLAEPSQETGLFRRIHDLCLLQSHLPIFIMPWTLVHVIDETSPLFGHTAETLEASSARIFVTIEARDQALGAQVQDMQDYSMEHLRFGMHFANAVVMDEDGNTTADLSRISLLEPDAPV